MALQQLAKRARIIAALCGGVLLNYILRGSKNSSNDDVFQLFVRRLESVVDDDGIEKRTSQFFTSFDFFRRVLHAFRDGFFGFGAATAQAPLEFGNRGRLDEDVRAVQFAAVFDDFRALDVDVEDATDAIRRDVVDGFEGGAIDV